MRALIVAILSLVGSVGCIQPTGPARPTEMVAARSGPAAIESQARLVLSVKTGARVVASDWILQVTLGIRNSGSEPVILGASPGSYIRLDFTNSGGLVAKEYRLPLFSWSPIRIEAKQAWSTTVELLADLDPGLYQVTMSLSGLPGVSPPCIIRIVPPRDGSR